MKSRIYHDFNKIYSNDENGIASAPLVCFGTKCDIERLNISLVDGMAVILYQPDDVKEDGSPDCLEVDATVRHDKDLGIYFADFIWKDLGYQSKK